MSGPMGPSPTGRLLCDPVLELLGVPHGFSERGAQVPESTLFPRQVHGIGVIRYEDVWPARERVEGDAVLCATAGRPIGIVTADCVPILVASADGGRVAAIHAGWRGLAAGVIEAAIDALGLTAGRLSAAVGPAIRACCYEVDDPVAAGLSDRYRALLDEVLTPGRADRPGRYQLDLPRLATRVLDRLGIPRDRIGTTHRLCTRCSPGPRFESFRRDGAAAGRMGHFIAPLGGGGTADRRPAAGQG